MHQNQLTINFSCLDGQLKWMFEEMIQPDGQNCIPAGGVAQEVLLIPVNQVSSVVAKNKMMRM